MLAFHVRKRLDYLVFNADVNMSSVVSIDMLKIINVHLISNLKIRYHNKKITYYVGLFSDVGSGGALENLRMRGLHLTVSGRAYSGGMVGINEGTLFGDEVSGYSRNAGGGLASGNSTTGTIISSSADVTMDNGGGGFIAENAGSISLSHADGNATGDGGEGAFIGDNEGAISQSYATGSGYGAGFAGYSESDGQNTVEIDNSYATGAAYDAGFVGDDGDGNLHATVSSSYSTGAVAEGEAGFVCEAAFDDFTYDYWDTTTSGTDQGTCYNGNIAGVTGLTSKELKSQLPQGFDPAIWAVDPKINKGFPYLIANAPDK